MNFENIEEIIEKCFKELEKVNSDKYDAEMVDKTASLFLMAQMKLSILLEDAEMKAKNSKNEISRIEGEKYFEYKNSHLDKKITENMLTNYVAKDSDVVSAKRESAQYEANLKKWNYLLSSLKDGHIFFRNLGKNKSWSE